MTVESHHHHFQHKCLARISYLYIGQWFNYHDACCFREFYTGWLTHLGERSLQRLMLILRLLPWKRFWHKNDAAVLHCSQTPIFVPCCKHGSHKLWAIHA